MSLLKGSDTLREMYPKVNSKFADLDAKDQELKDELDAYKLEHEQQRQSDQLKVAMVEKELNDYKATMQQINIHQSPTQKASGYGIVSLPKNAAEGQVNDIKIEGKTYRNILEDYFGKRDSWEILYGELIDNDFIKGTADGSYKNFFLRSFVTTLKPSTQYTIFVEVRKNTLTGGGLYVTSVHQGDPFVGAKEISPGRTGIFKFLVLTKSDLTFFYPLRMFISQTATSGEIEFRAMLLEGDYTNENISYIRGTKSTVGAMRLKSVSEDESEVSTAYVVAKDEEGNIAELRSLPNGTKDEINLTQGKATIRTGKLIIGNIGFNNATSYDDNYYRAVKTGILQGLNMVYQTENSGIGYCTDGNFRIFPNASPSSSGVERGMALYADGHLYVFVEKSKIDAMSGTTLVDKFNSYFAQYPVTLIYQLATPLEIPIQVSGTLVSYPSGTVYVEPFVADAGLYNNGITVLHQDLPIKSIEKISKIDYETGIEYELDKSKAVINTDKLSLTHPDLQNGDIVFFIYEYDKESTIPEIEVEFYDSRYVVKDSATGKFYKWSIAVTNGTPSIQLTEV